MKTIAVFFGGQSPEHDISILTGIQAFQAFDTKIYNPIPVYVTRDGIFYIGSNIAHTHEYKNIEALLEKSTQVHFEKSQDGVFLCFKKFLKTEKIKIECAFLAFHGGGGEGGSFQGLCESIGLPYTGSNVLGSALCMDKVSMKQILQKADIPVSEYVVALEDQFTTNQKLTIDTIEQKLAYPLFIKPSNGGSSIGVSRAKNAKELVFALELAFSFDAKVLIEKEFEYDTEVNISCLGTWNKQIEFSMTEEVYSDTEFLDFENKYLKGAKSKKISLPSGSKGMASANRRVPADISSVLGTQIEVYAKKAFQVLNCGGVARLDFLVNKKTGNLVLVELNSIPGSLAYYLWEPSGKPFSKLIDEMIVVAFDVHEEKLRHARNFTSNVFKNF